MGIFGKIKDVIFGSKDAKKEESREAEANSTPQEGEKLAPIEVIDVEAQLDARPGADALNWRTSIVDLMKLIGLDASFEERKELAAELGRFEYSGSADDNVWLHWAVMKALADHGGKVPDEFRD